MGFFRARAQHVDDVVESWPVDLSAQLHQFMAKRGGVGAIRPIGGVRLVADHVDKFIVHSAAGAPSAVVALAPACDRESARRSARRAQRAHDRLDERLASAILVPTTVGDSEAESYSIAPFCDPLTRFDFAMGVGSLALRWLEETTRHTARRLDAGEVAERCVVPLQRLQRHAAVRDEERAAAAAALRALDAGDWAPAEVLAHNDLWTGNFLRMPRLHDGPWPFVIIDWDGSSLAGHAAYDLVRLAGSLRLRPATLGRQLRVHAAALSCPATHLRHALVTSFGELAGHLGAWPEASFAATLTGCLDALDRALATLDLGGSSTPARA